MTYAAITGWGKCMPTAILTNDDLSTFLDTSDVVELTSLVIAEDDSMLGSAGAEADPAWTRLAVTHIRVWDPKKTGRIEAAPLEEYLANVIPLFRILRLRESRSSMIRLS